MPSAAAPARSSARCCSASSRGTTGVPPEFQRADEQIGDEQYPQGGDVEALGMRLDAGQAPAGGRGVDRLAGSGVDDAQHGASVGGHALVRSHPARFSGQRGGEP